MRLSDYLNAKFCSFRCYQQWRVWRHVFPTRKEMLDGE
jgi:hypothetical protein